MEFGSSALACSVPNKIRVFLSNGLQGRTCLASSPSPCSFLSLSESIRYPNSVREGYTVISYFYYQSLGIYFVVLLVKLHGRAVRPHAGQPYTLTVHWFNFSNSILPVRYLTKVKYCPFRILPRKHLKLKIFSRIHAAFLWRKSTFFIHEWVA